jgi:hypothetical protein
MDRENVPRAVNFDCMDAHWAVRGLEELWRHIPAERQDMFFRIEINVCGPGGGNPEVYACNFGPELGEKIVDWMIVNGLSWTDQDGEIFDYAYGPEGPLRRCDRCCEPAYEEGKLCWEHLTGRM